MSAEGSTCGGGTIVDGGGSDGWGTVETVVVDATGDGVDVVMISCSAVVHALMTSAMAPRRVVVLDRMVIPSGV